MHKCVDIFKYKSKCRFSSIYNFYKFRRVGNREERRENASKTKTKKVVASLKITQPFGNSTVKGKFDTLCAFCSCESAGYERRHAFIHPSIPACYGTKRMNISIIIGTHIVMPLDSTKSYSDRLIKQLSKLSYEIRT